MTELHNAWCLKLAADPVCLIKVVDEHEFHSDVATVDLLHTSTHCLLEITHKHASQYNNDATKKKIKKIIKNLKI
jgi:uncharacterized protein YqfB (UPF0267 family)